MQKRNWVYVLFMVLVLALGVSQPVQAKNYKTYKVSASTKPCDKKNQQKAKKDKAAKTTYMLRSYFEKIEKAGGGTLILKKGTYKIYENLYVPSNTTVRFEKGVKIVAQKRSSLTGVFIPLPPSKIGKSNFAKGYKSSKNVKFEGAENVIIDLGKSDASAFYFAHNNKITVSDIQFKKNNKKRQIIEFLGSSNITIANCTFTGKDRTGNAISIDIPAKKKKKTRKWCKMDDTMNKNVTITNCTFTDLNRAIATLRYVDKKYQQGFKITNCTFTNIEDDVIRAINWNDVTITGNTFEKVSIGGQYTANGKNLKRAVYLAGVKKVNLTDNTFDDLPRAIELNVYKNTDSNLKSYKPTKNQVTMDEIETMLNRNTIKTIRDYTLRVYRSDSDNDCDRYYYPDSTTTYVITTKDTPYRNTYFSSANYNEHTRHHYVFRAVMDQIERNNRPCTIIVKAGTYKISNEIPIMSNVTIQFEDGVVMKKTSKTGDATIDSNNGIFAFVEPAAKDAEKKYSGYNGVHDVKLLGPEKGTATLDLCSYPIGIALVMAHTKNIEISNLTFVGADVGHYIELDASQNVVVQGCSFKGHKDSTNHNKEAINLDTPDKYTQGFIRNWTSYDKTANQNIKIVDNVFDDIEVGVGTHSYSENKPHKNIFIERNRFSNCDGAAIMAMNWENVNIIGNTIENVALHNQKEYAFELNGVNNLTVQNNVISNVEKIAKIKKAKQSSKSTVADAYAPVPCNISLAQKNTFMTSNTFRSITNPVVECADNVVDSVNGTWDLSSYVK